MTFPFRFCAALLLLSPYAAPAQVESQSHLPSVDLPDFYVDAMSFFVKDSVSARVDMYVQVPYEDLRFIAVDSSFVARYEISVSIFLNKENIVAEKIWNEEIRVRTFDQTQSKQAYSLTQRSFWLSPGAYVLRAQLRDAESRKATVVQKKIDVTDYPQSVFSLSDVMLVNRVTEEDAGKKTIVPNVSGNIGTAPGGFYLFFEIYNAVGADSVELTYEVKDRKENQVFYRSERRPLEGQKTQEVVRIDSSRYPTGSYTLMVDARTMKKGNDETVYDAKKQRGFFIRWGNMPMTVMDIDLADRQLRYIAREKEYDEIIAAKTLEEKQKLFQEFWRRRDPSPDTERNEYMEDYYQRVEYSNEHFSHYIEGWRTDMGMVFIVFGAPSNVERHPFDTDSKPYEIWSYYDMNRQIIFVDETGFGDYRLATPIWDLLRRVIK